MQCVCVRERESAACVRALASDMELPKLRHCCFIGKYIIYDINVCAQMF